MVSNLKYYWWEHFICDVVYYSQNPIRIQKCLVVPVLLVVSLIIWLMCEIAIFLHYKAPFFLLHN